MSLDMTVLSKENIQLLWKIRKLIRNEFSFELKISDHDALDHLSRFEAETNDPKLRHLIKTVLLSLAPNRTVRMGGQIQSSNKPSLNVKRMYRGQEIKA